MHHNIQVFEEHLIEKTLKKITYSSFTEITGKKDVKYPHFRNYCGKNKFLISNSYLLNQCVPLKQAFFKKNLTGPILRFSYNY